MSGHARTAAVAEREDERHGRKGEKAKHRSQEEGKLGDDREDDKQKTTDQQNTPGSNPPNPKDPGGRT